MKQNETTTRNNYSPLWKSRRVINGQDNPRINHNRPQLDSLEIELDENVGDEKYLVSVVYASLGELPAFLFGWVEILINVTTVSACRYHNFWWHINVKWSNNSPLLKITIGVEWIYEYIQNENFEIFRMKLMNNTTKGGSQIKMFNIGQSKPNLFCNTVDRSHAFEPTQQQKYFIKCRIS